MIDHEQQWRGYVERMAAGDSDAMSSLYRETVSMLLGLAVRILRDQHDAEEVILEVYEQAWRNAKTYDPARSRVLWWLTMMTRSRCFDRLRASKRRVSVEVPMPETFDAAAGGPDPDSQVAYNQERRRIRAAIKQLSAEQRQALELAFYAGMSHSEIAERLNTPLGTIKTRIRSALKSLRYTLDDGIVAGQMA